MNRFRKFTLCLIGVAIIALVTGLTSQAVAKPIPDPVVKVQATDKQVSARGGATGLKNSSNSNVKMKVYAEEKCKGEPVTLSPGEWSPRTQNYSFYQKPHRSSWQSYWTQWNFTWDKGRCINVWPSPINVVTIKKWFP